jgi:hypothetical protein
MLMGEFMTAVHHGLPVKAVVYNNSALGLITLEAESVGLVPFREAIEFPNPDFAALARACGGHGFTARQPGELKAALSEALAVDGPAIVDAVVVADAEHAAYRSRAGRPLRRGQDQGSRPRRHRRLEHYRADRITIAHPGLVVRDARRCRAPHHEGPGEPHPEEPRISRGVSKDEAPALEMRQRQPTLSRG